MSPFSAFEHVEQLSLNLVWTSNHWTQPRVVCLVSYNQYSQHGAGTNLWRGTGTCDTYYRILIQGVPGGNVNILGGHCIGHSKKNFIWTCVLFRTISDIWRAVFWNWSAIYSFPPSLWAITLHTDSHAPDIGALRWEGRKILRAKYRKPFRIGHMFI
jgi:hypothetical protein